MELSDFPPPYSTGVLTKDSRQGPQRHPLRPVGGISRFPNERFIHVHGVYDHAGPISLSRLRDRPCCLPLSRQRRHPGWGSWMRVLSRLNTRPMYTPVNASLSPLRVTTH